MKSLDRVICNLSVCDYLIHRPDPMCTSLQVHTTFPHSTNKYIYLHENHTISNDFSIWIQMWQIATISMVNSISREVCVSMVTSTTSWLLLGSAQQEQAPQLANPSERKLLHCAVQDVNSWYHSALSNWHNTLACSEKSTLWLSIHSNAYLFYNQSL